MYPEIKQEWVAAWCGLSLQPQGYVMTMNDSGRMTFSEIADLIEAQL